MEIRCEKCDQFTRHDAIDSLLEQRAKFTNERDQLRAELEKLRGELDDAEERASEAEERCAAEWEKDCGQALRILAQVTKFEWDQDGSPADEVREHIQITIESLEKQLLSLRAELAAAKNLLARIHRDGGHHTEAVGFAQSVADAGDKVSEWLLAAEERTALAAHVERLRQAMEEALPSLCYSGWPDGIKAALAATPSQSLAAHDAAVKVAVLREVAEKLRNEESSNSNLHAEFIEAEAIHILDEADRVEKEAANG